MLGFFTRLLSLKTKPHFLHNAGFIISFFGFLYSALIFANALGEVSGREFKKAREIGKVLVSIDNKDIVAKDDLIDTPLERLKSIKNSKK